jgi:hypothetical protein
MDHLMEWQYTISRGVTFVEALHLLVQHLLSKRDASAPRHVTATFICQRTPGRGDVSNIWAARRYSGTELKESQAPAMYVFKIACDELLLEHEAFIL